MVVACFRLAHGIRDTPRLQGGKLLQMDKQGMVKQQTQGHSSDRPLYVWLFGQVRLPFIEVARFV
jgi:hypothetical protein